MGALETIEYNGHTIEIHQDLDPQNPRTEYDNLGTMVCFHNRYDLGDRGHGYDKGDFDSWDELEAQIYKDNDVAVCLPLYLYDHSGITMNTTGFSCRWDSGQVGFIFISKEKARSEYSAKRISPKLRGRLTTYLKNEVETYDHYLTGSVYGYQIVDQAGADVDSCWGFFGDHEASGLIEYAKNAIDCNINYSARQAA